MRYRVREIISSLQLKRNFGAFPAKLNPELFIAPEKDNFYLQQMRKSIEARGLENKISLDRMVELSTRVKEGDAAASNEYQELANKLPNLVHPITPIGKQEKARLLYLHGEKAQESEAFPREEASMYATSRRDQFLLSNRKQKKETPRVKLLLKNALNSLKLNNTSAGTGPRTFYFLDSLAMLEQALIDYALDKLIEHDFCMVSVPEVLPLSVIEACGFPVQSERDQIYKIVQSESNGPEMALAGTSEMSLAAFCAGRNLGIEEEESKAQYGDSADVLGLCAASKCFRREVSTVESTLYRTHQFNKVEMFCVTQPSLMVSDAMFERMLRLQIELLSGLDLHFRVMEMPSYELGLSAFRKVDIEVWMPAEKFFGEVSSTSNCTDYQSRRLQITWSNLKNDSNNSAFAHTLNGTACAVPRLMKAIIETHQQADSSVLVPEVLRPYMDGMKYIRPNQDYELEWIAKLKN